MAFLSNQERTDKSENKVINSISDLNVENNVRVLLFREFGSKGRKLLFDSFEPKTLPPIVSEIAVNSSVHFHKLTDMVFGSVSLRCHETYFRIHNLSSSNSIMFTQIFPSPGSRKMKPFTGSCQRVSSTIRNLDSFYMEGGLYNNAVSNNSFTFDSRATGLGLQVYQNEYNVPNTSTNTFDSGYGEQSFNSLIISNRSNFSSDTPLDHNKLSNLETYTNLTDTDLYSKDSTVDYSTGGSSTLGLVVILAVTSDKKEYFKCYMKHIAFIESVVLRIRRNLDMAVDRTGIILSAMVEASYKSSQWLMRIFPELQKHNINEINKCRNSNRYCEEMHDDPLKLKITSLMFKINHQKSSIVRDIIFPKKYVQGNTGVLLRNESGKRFKEFCELINILENKETNFFASTIITATLTYHLGWITTCFSFPSSNVVQQLQNSSYNSLWRQIAELCGAYGSPIKLCQTIVNGLNRNEMVSKVLQFIHYFIRYSTILYNCIERIDVNKDNESIDKICLNYTNYGNYPDEQCLSRNSSERGVISTLNKSRAWFNLLQLSCDDSSKENYALKENKVKFLLGDNEELINLKPAVTSNLKTTPKENISVKMKSATLNSSRYFMNIFKYSNSCSVLDDLWKSVRQKHNSTRFKIFNKIDGKRSKSESPKVMKEKVFNFENKSSDIDLKADCIYEKIPIQMANPNLNYSDANGHVFSVARKQRTFPKTAKMKFFSFPLPKSKSNDMHKTSYTSMLKSDRVGTYVPDVVIQGTNLYDKDWKLKLKRDLYLTRQTYFLHGYVDESVAIVGNTDTWDVEIISSRVSINQNQIGMRLDTSSLIGNMFDVLQQMWNLRFCQKYCTTHIEQRLLEICIHSYACGQQLLHTNMCTMDLLTTTLHFDISDIPLLMSVASIIVPEVTKKYGLSFQ